MKTSRLKPVSTSLSRKVFLLLVAALGCLMASDNSLRAQPIAVPNSSFESQAAGPPFYATPFVDSWQKAPKPGYFDEAAFGFTWDQTAGVFLDNFIGNPSPLDNRDGNQGAYLLAFPGVSLFQDYNTTDWNHTTPTHAFNATFQVGQSYQLTIGVVGRNGISDGTSLLIGLYYGDSSNPSTIAATVATYSASAFPSSTHLVDYTVTIPTVQAGDAWAGQNIGIELINTVGDGHGNWDLDNVRLSQIPEPSSLTLLALSLGGVLIRLRSRPKV